MNFIIILAFLSLLFRTVVSLKCYQCSNNETADCSEVFDASRAKIKPMPCDHVYNAKYCVKTTGLFEGKLGTQRFCTSRRYENYCQYIKRRGDKFEQRSCIFSCDSDACNRHFLYYPSIQLILIAFIYQIMNFISN